MAAVIGAKDLKLREPMDGLDLSCNVGATPQ
jgi:hypothetical protein